MTFPNEKEKIKAEIEVLTKKLSLLEEMEKHKSPVEECYKDWWGQYPETGTWDGFDEKRWQGFQAGYEFAYAMKTAQSEGVFDEPKPETLTLKQLLKKWEIDFAANWAKNRTSELYEEEVERFIQMFTEWMPYEINDNGLSEWDHGWNTGYSAYRNNLMRKLK